MPSRYGWMVAGAALVTALGPVAQAATYSVIYSTTQQNADVQDVFAANTSGLLFGTAALAPNSPGGAVLVLSPPAANSQVWTFHYLYLFGAGAMPAPLGTLFPAGVTLVNDGLVGTTSNGDTYNDGAVYRLNLPLPLTGTTLHAFSGTSTIPVDGETPAAGLTVGPFRTLYGTTNAGGGGSLDGGIVYSIDASGANYQVLHRFEGAGDGRNPQRGRLIFDSQGRLYDTTGAGGANDLGTVYMMQHTHGAWHEQVLYSFQPGSDVQQPVEGVVMDSQGNLYGCAQGGSHGFGGIYQLAPPAQPGGAWSETALYNFGSKPGDPYAQYGFCALAIDPATTRLFGTSYQGGAFGVGTIFELDPPAAGQTAWTESLIHSFTGTAIDGKDPIAPPLKVGATYYGATTYGSFYAFTP